jgi:hypothetical protein
VGDMMRTFTIMNIRRSLFTEREVLLKTGISSRDELSSRIVLSQ